MIAFYLLNELYIEKTTTPPCHIFIPNKNMKFFFFDACVLCYSTANINQKGLVCPFTPSKKIGSLAQKAFVTSHSVTSIIDGSRVLSKEE
jgi:hypothetical protein